MKRELKGGKGPRHWQNEIRNRAIPDEEGTESFHWSPVSRRKQIVTEPFPMKRELKVQILGNTSGTMGSNRAIPDEEGTESPGSPRDRSFYFL